MTVDAPGALPSVLVANRGEIVVRVCRTLAARSIRSYACYTPEDRGAAHVRAADAAVEVASYLDAAGIVAAAQRVGAVGVHPGYGFLSEDAAFARAVLEGGLVWIGPPPAAIEAMGDKIRAKVIVAAAGVPVVPGAGEPGLSDEELAAAALGVGLPVLLKPAAGGGGKGMRRVTDEGQLSAAIAAARREAAGAFGDDTLLVEHLVRRPRHVEVQVFADAHGSVVHLGERECSLQRRHQKIVEESPSPLLDDATRAAMAQSAIDAARACGYVGAGTVEFIVSGDRPDEYFFMEMNTRLQVEHPVTEAVTGIDLVDWQLRVAAGEPLPCRQEEIVSHGHAVEARIYAEDPERQFLPATGTVARWREPAGCQQVRVDSSLADGTEVGTRYDPMLAKVVAWDETREGALARLRGALEHTVLLGVTSNVGYLTRLLALPDVMAGRIDTELVERTLAQLCAPTPGARERAAVAAACAVAFGLEDGARQGPWGVPDGWTLSGPRPWILALRVDGEAIALEVRGRVTDGARLSAGGREMAVAAHPAAAGTLTVTVDGVTDQWAHALVGDDVWVACAGQSWCFAPDRVARGEQGTGALGSDLSSPMPGVVVAVHVVPGERVRAGHALVAVEAMKMEHAVVAPCDGLVADVLVRVGQAVGLGEALVDFDAEVPAGGLGDGRGAP